MKILSVAEFDAAGVLAGHRAALRPLGVDYRLAIKDAYRDAEVDFAPGLRPGDTERLRDFAGDADIIQFHPAIGQPWSYTTYQPMLRDGEDEGLFGIDWPKVGLVGQRRVSYFHGSRNAQVNHALYAKHWRERGHAIWASTIDYAEWMGATYAPPALEDVSIKHGLAPLRGDDDPLVVAHSPTDPGNCHTASFEEAVRAAGAVALMIFRQQHEKCLQSKLGGHAGFDHLRGCFSVNTLENAALQLAPLFGLRREFRDRMDQESVDTPPWAIQIETVHQLITAVRKLEADPALTREMQYWGRLWYWKTWRPEIVGPRLKKLYEAL